MFFLKQFVAAVTEPLTAAVLLAIVGLIVRTVGWRKTGTATVAVALLAGYAVSTDFVSAWLLRPLESRYPPILDRDAMPDVAYVVVLGHDYYADANLPITANLAPEAIVRVSEGVRLLRRLPPQAKLVVTGGVIPGRGQVSLGSSLMAQSLGVPETSIVVLADALDTAGEARDLRAFLGDAPFVLVTSASHMPRAMRLMARAGTNPIPAPTGHRTENHPAGDFDWRGFLPAGDNLVATNMALHEYLGLIAIAVSLGEPATLD